MPNKQENCHSAEDEKVILKQIKCLVDKLGNPCPSEVQQRAQKKYHFCESLPKNIRRNEEDPPLITHVSLLELRPTSEYRRSTTKSGQGKNVIYVPVDPPQSQHLYPPWGQRDCECIRQHDAAACKAASNTNHNRYY